VNPLGPPRTWLVAVLQVRAAAPRTTRLAPLLVSFVLGALLATGCVHGSAPRGRVVVMPVDTLGVAPDEGEALERVFRTEVERSPSVSPVSPVPTGTAAAPSSHPACRDSDACLAGVGRRASADLVLSTTLAGLGDMRLVRARLLRVEGALVLQDLQETVPGGPRQLAERAASIARRLFPETRRPWYRTWWVWTTIAGAAALVGVTTFLIVRSQKTSNDPSLVHVGDL
jgi:hypothetical protein